MGLSLFKVVVVRLDSCKGLSRGGKPAEGGPTTGGVLRIVNFWERFDEWIRSASMRGGCSLWDWTVQGAGCSYGRCL